MAIQGKLCDFNKNWKFKLTGDSSQEKVLVDDSNWREISVPHDWSVEFSFDEDLGEGCTGYLPGGIGWYRKHFPTPSGKDESRVYINFDGIYNHSIVFMNGKEVISRPYGYVPITIDVTDYLNDVGDENVIAVKVDHSRYVDSRWYTGSGIYRNVRMMVADNVHIPIDGTYVSTLSVSPESAAVKMDITLNNLCKSEENISIEYQILDPNQAVVYDKVKEYSLKPSKKQLIEEMAMIDNPLLWDVYIGRIYTLSTRVMMDGEMIQTYKTSFGIRTIEFTKDKGFFINGRNEKIKGVCLHHDGGLVGSAVPKAVWRRRLKKLIEGGTNGIRCAHNPPSAEFLDLCDELGLLVQNEFFDEWDNPKDKRLNMYERHDDYVSRGYAESFREWAEQDLKDIMLRDRNHPSIIQWSIGNEIEWPYPNTLKATGYFEADANGNYFWTKPPYSHKEIKKAYKELPDEEFPIEETVKKLAHWTREMDKTRPVTANCILPSGTYATGATDYLDIVGTSYRRVMYDDLHETYPDKPIMGTENLGQWHEWKAVMERDFISGMFIWTGIEYMGEAQGAWPRKSSASGMLNLAGFEKPSFNMMKSLWIDEPTVSIYSNRSEDSIYRTDGKGKFYDSSDGGWDQRLWSWHDVKQHWNFEDKDKTIVEVYTNCERVELLLNNVSLGVKNLADFEDHVMKWEVPFESGELKAIGINDGMQVCSGKIVTAEDIQGVAIKHHVESGTKEGEEDVINTVDSIIHVEAQLVDSKGNPIRHSEETLEFSLTGSGTILGVDNGYHSSTEDYQKDYVTTYEGRCLMIIKTDGHVVNVGVSVKDYPGIEEEIEIMVK